MVPLMRRLPSLCVVLTMFAGLALADEASTRCTMAGVIFSMDPIGGTLILKDTDGYLKNVSVTAKTDISKLSVLPGGNVTPLRPADLNSGDLVCVHGGTPPKLSVVPRNDLHRAQADFLAGWQRNSLYGTLSSVDAGGRILVVKPLPPSAGETPVRVSLPASVQLRAALPNARHIRESTSFRLEDLKPGEPVYLRGERPGDGSEMKASIVLKGGYRGILGTLVEAQIGSSVLRIHEFGTGRTLSMKIAPGELYRTIENITNPMRVVTASGVVLAPVGLADIQPGDAILVIGRTTGDSTQGDGLVAVTKFGAFGVLPQDPQNRVSWVIAK